MKVVILGAGITGLSLGWYLEKRFGTNIDLKILEASSRPGGWIRTVHHEEFLFEEGPRSLRTAGSGKAALDLIEEIGLGPEVLPASSSAKSRYLYIDKSLQKLPNGLFSLVFSPLRKIILKSLFRDIVAPKGNGEDETIASFACRRLGCDAANLLMDPLTSGIYAGDTHQLSIQACFPHLAETERSHRSLLIGNLVKRKKSGALGGPLAQAMAKHPIVTLKRGMESLPQALAESLQEKIYLNTKASRFHFSGRRAYVATSGSDTFEADVLVSCLPASVLSDLLAKPYPSESQLLKNIPYASVAVVNVGYERKVLPKEGFGYLIPHNQNERILGVVWDSSVFPFQNRHPHQTRLTVMIGGSRMEDFAQYRKEDFLRLALESLSSHLGIDAEPSAVHVKIAAEAIPQYPVGHCDSVKKLEKSLPLYLLGSSLKGVSVGDCISTARRLAESLESEWKQT